MKKVTALVGSARKKHTHGAVRRFLDHLQALGDVDCEIVTLSDYRLESCRGCKQCFEKGEEFCPLKDDRDVLIEKMTASDGVVFATPNYMFQVSAIMKTFLDRLGFIGHRPRFFGKTFTCIVTQGFYGADKITKYLNFVGAGLGFNTVKGSCITALEPMTERESRIANKALEKLSRRFHKKLVDSKLPMPKLFWLMAFRMGRTNVRLNLDDLSRDYTYYKEKGWFESDYYYPTRLGPVRKVAGAVFDWMSARMSKQREG